MKRTILSVTDLEVSFPGIPDRIPVVRGVNFEVSEDEVLCIVGESGSGKSVTALAIAGLLPAAAQISGSIRLNGEELIGATSQKMRDIRGRDIGFIFQDPSTTLNPVQRVGQQITEAQVWHGMLPRSEAPARAIELLKEVEIAAPAVRARQYPHQFSGGMRQRAVIGMAMAGRPSLIIADEPTTALDVTVQAQVLELLSRRQRESRAPIILITHDLGVVAETAHRVAVMYGGRIVETGTVDEIFANPRHPYTAALLQSIPRHDTGNRRLEPIPGHPVTPTSLPRGCSFAPRCARSQGRAVCIESEPPLTATGTGGAAACFFLDEKPTARPLAEARHRSAAADQGARDTPLLEVEGLKVHFPIKRGILQRSHSAIRAVDGVSFALFPGETVSLVGESGCGKSTTARTIMGLQKATAGTVRFNGELLGGLSRTGLRRARRNMQYVFQDPFASLNPIKPVEEIVAEPLRIHGLYEEFGGEAHIAELFELVGLSRDMFGRYPAEFSGGQKQRIGIARALSLKPKLLILDEPVAALDVSIQAQILNLLEDLQKELSLSYLFIAHNLSVVRHISDRVSVMYLGRIVEQASRDDLYERPQHPYTQSLLSAAPVPDPVLGRQRRRITLKGEIPDPENPPPGCSFSPRCFRASERCRSTPPNLEAGVLNGEVACFHPGPMTTADAAQREVAP
jgi:peptide/nickel transport system ATP-binding protein